MPLSSKANPASMDLLNQKSIGSPIIVLKPDRLIDQVVSAGLWTAGLVWLIPMMSLQNLLMRFFEPYRIDWLARIYTRGQVMLTGSSYRAEVHPDINPNRPYIFVQNHINHLDHCVLYAATPHFKQGIELEEHFRFPIYGSFMKKRGTIPVARNSSLKLRQLVARTRRELERGHSLLAFPEGTRTLDGRLGPFDPGIFRIARILNASIIPVTVTGMYRVMRKGSYLIRPGYRVTVYCDQPVDMAGTSISDVSMIMQQVHRTISNRIDKYWTDGEVSWLPLF